MNLNLSRRALVVRHVEVEGPGRLADVMAGAGWSLDLRAMDRGDELPPSLDGYGAVVVLGGPMSVHEEDRHPYLRPLDVLLRAAVDSGLPTLGICLGGQLLAKALGAPVTRAPRPEVGWCVVELEPAAASDPLFAGLPRQTDVFQWHGDTFALPAGATPLAGSRLCPRQAFRHGRRAYGVQFHLEVTPDMVARWVDAYGGDASLASPEPRVHARFAECADRFLANWQAILEAAADP